MYLRSMKLIQQLEEKAAKFGLTVDYDGSEVVIVCPDGLCFYGDTQTSIYSPWDSQPVVACIRQALREVEELGQSITKQED